MQNEKPQVVNNTFGSVMLAMSICILLLALFVGGSQTSTEPLNQIENLNSSNNVDESLSMSLMTEKLVKSLEKEIDRLSIENLELKERASQLEINKAKQILEHEQNKNEITERIEAKFSELIAAGLNKNELKSQVEGMRIELSKIIDEKET